MNETTNNTLEQKIDNLSIEELRQILKLVVEASSEVQANNLTEIILNNEILRDRENDEEDTKKSAHHM